MRGKLSFLTKRFFIMGIAALLASCTSLKTLDVSDIGLRNAKTPTPALVTSGQPTVSDLEALASRGVKNVVNLRTEGEFDDFDEAAEAERLGLNYIQLPIAGAQDINRENAQKLHEILADLDGQTLLHCGSGNRVGALLAVKAATVDGKTREEAIEFGLAAGLTRLEAKAREVIEEEQ